MTKLHGGPGRDETAVNLSSFQNLKSSQNDQNRLVPFATVGNLEKFEFCEAETIYMDRTFKASCSISSSRCMLCIMVSTSVTQSTTSQRLDSIKYTLSIPTSSTSHFVNSHFVNSHFVNIDQMGIDQMGIDEVGS